MIAIIEDDVHIGDIIEESLRREGYQTCRAYSGTEAQYLLADQKAGQELDLILLDQGAARPHHGAVTEA